MRGLDVPPRTEDFTADPVELFFDLAFVFAFSQLVSHLVHHPDWTGVAEAALLFGLLWFVWSVFTWSANAVSGNARSTRLIFLIATASMVPMAASVSTAFDTGGALFAMSGAVIMAMGLGLQLWGLPTGSEEFRSSLKFGSPTIVAMAVLVTGGLVDGSARIVLWILAMLIIFGATVAAGGGTWIVRFGHFAERHGLIIIIALGEVIVAIGIAVVGSLDGGGLSDGTKLGLVAAGALAGLLWWSYFDRVLPALEHGGSLVPESERGRYARDVYTWLHLPIVGGIIFTAAAAEEVLLHPNDPTPLEFRWMLVGGLAAILLGVAAAVARAYRVVAKERMVGALVIAAAGLILGREIDGVVLLLIVDVILLILILAEHVRIEKPVPA